MDADYMSKLIQWELEMEQDGFTFVKSMENMEQQLKMMSIQLEKLKILQEQYVLASQEQLRQNVSLANNKKLYSHSEQDSASLTDLVSTTAVTQSASQIAHLKHVEDMARMSYSFLNQSLLETSLRNNEMFNSSAQTRNSDVLHRDSYTSQYEQFTDIAQTKPWTLAMDYSSENMRQNQYTDYIGGARKTSIQDLKGKEFPEDSNRFASAPKKVQENESKEIATVLKQYGLGKSSAASEVTTDAKPEFKESTNESITVDASVVQKKQKPVDNTEPLHEKDESLLDSPEASRKNGSQSLFSSPEQALEVGREAHGHITDEIHHSENTEFVEASALEEDEQLVQNKPAQLENVLDAPVQNNVNLENKEVSEIGGNKNIGSVAQSDSVHPKSSLDEVVRSNIGDNSNVSKDQLSEGAEKNATAAKSFDESPKRSVTLQQSIICDTVSESDKHKTKPKKNVMSKKSPKKSKAERNNSLKSIRSFTATDSEDSFYEGSLPLTSSAAYKSLIGGTDSSMKPNQVVEESESDSEDDVERALAMATSNKSSKFGNQVVKTSKLSSPPPPANQNKKDDLFVSKRKPSVSAKTSSSRPSIAPSSKIKFSKATRQALGLDSESDEPPTVTKKQQQQQQSESSDEFDFYD